MDFGFIGSAVQGISNLFSNERNIALQQSENRKDRLFQSKEAQKQRDYNSVEAQKARDFNSSEAAVARQFNKEQADLAYKRNSYSSQMAQMRSAGVNPALAYSSGNFQPMGNVTASPATGPSASSGASPSGGHGFSPVSPPDLNAARMMAEIKLLNAQTKKTDAEGDNAISFQKIADQWYSGLIELNGSQIKVNSSVIKLNTEQAKQFEPLARQLEAQADFYSENADYYKELKSSVHEDVICKRIENAFRPDRLSAELDEIRSRTSLNNAQAKEILYLMTFKAANLSSQTLLNNKMAETELAKYGWYNAQTGLINEQKANEVLRGYGLQIQNDRMEFDFTQAQKFDSLERTAKIANALADSADNLSDYVLDSVDTNVDDILDNDYKETRKNDDGSRVSDRTSHKRSKNVRTRGKKIKLPRWLRK